MSDKQQNLFDTTWSKARELKAQKRYPEAMQLLRAELARHPDNARLKASLADLYYRTERYRDALALAGKMLKDDPDDPQALVVIGNVLLERKKPTEALEYFQLALQTAQTDYLWQRVARCHLDAKQPQAALAALVRAEALAPDSRELLRLMAETARSLHDSGTEREVFRRAANMAPKEPEDYANFLLPLLRDLPLRRMLSNSERMRETPGQELNPFLLLLEIEALTKLGDFEAARSRQATLQASDPPDSVRAAAISLLPARLEDDAP